jgi:hypothetical protein
MHLLLGNVAHICNPSYSGGRDPEDHSLKAAGANSLQDPISEKLITKKTGGVAQDVGPVLKKKKRMSFTNESTPLMV